IMANSSLGSGEKQDAYDYVEIYNNSNSPVKLKDYRLEWYGYGGSLTTWDFTSELYGDKVIPAKGTLVIWIKANDIYVGLKNLNDFNARYGTNLTSDQVVEYIGATLEDKDSRLLFISKDPSVKLSQARYNFGLDLNTPVKEDLSNEYKYPTNGTDVAKTIAIGGIPTPGIVDPSQVPYDPSDVTLSDIKVNGKSIGGFSKTVTDYAIELPYGTTVMPEITATTAIRSA
ncbi:lamin tail domain-containing protein, partial [Cutibacterium acnes]